MLIDFHTHCYPPHLASRAMGVCPTFLDETVFRPDGTVDGLFKGMQQAKVDVSVLLSVARTPGTMRNTNEYTAQLQKQFPSLVGFGSVHPLAVNVHEEIDHVVKLGLHGFKFHTTFQQFEIEDPRCEEVFRHIAQFKMPVVFHMGQATLSPEDPRTMLLPSRLEKVLHWFDGSPVVAAHVGGHVLDARQQKKEQETLWNLPVYTDVAFGSDIFRLDSQNALEFLEHFDPDKILFGSDTPWNTPEVELAFWNNLGMDSRSLEKLHWKNAARLLKTVGVEVESLGKA